MPDTKSGWTVDTLKEWVDQRFTDNQTAVGAALSANKEAVIKTEISTEKRFDAVTKSITELADETGDFLPRTEYIANHKALDDKIVVANDAINRSSGDKNLYATNAFVVQTVNQAVDNLAVKMDAILTPLVNSVTSLKGQSQGSKLTMGNIYTALGAFATIIGLIVFFAKSI